VLTPLVVLAALQLPTCATAGICAVADSAARANRTPGPVAAYTAAVETEIATIAVRERWVDGAVSVDQIASEVRWTRDGRFTQRVTGYRSATTTLPLNRARFLLLGWIAPVTAGDRLPVFGRHLGVEEATGAPAADTAAIYAYHPLGADRAAHYAFTALDTVAWTDPAGTARVALRLAVRSIGEGGERRLRFDGELFLEPGTLLLMRVRGRLLATGEADRQGLARLVRPPDQSFVDLQNLPVGEAWLPALQRFEYITARTLTEQPSGGMRIITRFRDVRAELLEADGAAFDPTPRYDFTAVPRDSLRGDDDWPSALGRETAEYALEEVDDIRLAAGRGRRGTAVGLGANAPGEFVRLNRIEGVYLGVGVTARPPRARPGTELHGNIGVGFADEVVRGSVMPSVRVGKLVLGVRGARDLAHTNEFMAQFSNPALGTLLARDNWDYVDRASVLLRGTYFSMTGRGGRAEVEFGYARDAAVERNVRTVPWVGFLRENRGVVAGDYAVARLLLDFHPDIGANFVRNGIGARLEAEVGGGPNLEYQRVVARVLARRNFPGLYLTAQAHAGRVWGAKLPPQQLLEMGGAVGLPGYEYKEFAGDVGALARLRLSMPLAVAGLDRPLPLGRSGFVLPPAAPSVSIGFQSGWTDVTTDAAGRAMAQLGTRFDTGTGEPAVDVNGNPLPASRASGGVRSSVDLRVTLFNDALGVGLTQPLAAGRSPSVFFVWGQQF
jgi:hypothetical protein